jgi:hypothetical protein
MRKVMDHNGGKEKASFVTNKNISVLITCHALISFAGEMSKYKNLL